MQGARSVAIICSVIELFLGACQPGDSLPRNCPASAQQVSSPDHEISNVRLWEMAQNNLMGRLAWYRTAANDLDIIPLARLQLLKRFSGKRETTRLTSKWLRYPVIARNGTSDLSVFHQIFVEREYRCLDSI
jgi:hypothetical protein